MTETPSTATATAASPTPTGSGPSHPAAGPSRTASLVSASALMAAGTLLSRLLGFGRLVLLGSLFGYATRRADMFTIANTVPNSMYILLAGGVLNTVLVPQIVRAIKGDADGGEAYTHRIMTAGLLGLALITGVLTLAAPLVVRLYSSSAWRDPALAPQYGSMVVLSYYCMPQIFFYGVHVLAGQVLNARDRFGPMMWAPIANNIVSIGVLLLFLGVFGRGATGAAFSTQEELLLGLGSTLGIVVQAAVLVPFLQAAGYRYRPRFDFRGVGLGKTVGLAKWTLGFVLVTQLALVVVSRLATSATAAGPGGGGLTAYYSAYALWILPHSLITVSLATAMLPAASRLAAAGDLEGVAAETMRAIRLALTVLLPSAVAFLVLGVPLTRVVFGFGAGARDSEVVGYALMALALGLAPFTVQYLCLRAYYALEDTRTPFLIQLVISGANVVLGLAAVALLNRPSLVATGLALAYSLAYALGVVVSLGRLRRRLPALDTFALVRHSVRLLLAVLPAAVAALGLTWWLGRDVDTQLGRALVLAGAGAVAVILFLVAAKLLGIAEIDAMLRTLLRRGGSGVGGTATDVAEARLAAGTGADLGAFGDSDTLIRPPSPTIEPPPTAGPASQPPPGTDQNADSMAQAAIVRTHPEDEAEPGGASSLSENHDGPVPPTATPTKAATLPAGTVLGARYRLEELLAGSGAAITWRAFDLVLSRSVLLHLLPPGDESEDDLMAAARRASVATDSRFLRVLDAVPAATGGADPELGPYIVCEYATGQSLEVILSHGPLSGLEAGWVIREVADALSGVHSLGLHHRRISPETVIITPTGNVKIVGLLIEAALRPAKPSSVHGADTPERVDVTDLGRLLYACLVCRWPGGPGFTLPDAPTVGRRWMTPRQVRAGVSPALDNVCDQVLGDPPRHRAPQITDANELVNALTKVLGAADAAGDLERRLRQPIPKVGAHTAAPVSPLLDQPTEPTPVVTADGTTPHRTAAADASPVRSVSPASVSPASVSPASVSPASVSPASVSPASPAAAGPGQAPADGAGGSVTTTVIRTPVPGRPATAPRRPPRQPRRWIAVLVMLIVMLLGLGLVGALVLNDRLTAAPTPEPRATPAQPTSAAPAPTVLPISSARDFDPQGADDQRENPDEVRYAYDGDPSTRWRTVSYIGNPELGGLKRGVGVVFDLGSAQPVASVEVTLSGNGTDLDLRVPKADPASATRAPLSSDAQWQAVADASDAGRSVTLTPDQPVTTRFVLVYLTSLPREGGQYRGGISEIVIRG